MLAPRHKKRIVTPGMHYIEFPQAHFKKKSIPETPLRNFAIHAPVNDSVLHLGTYKGPLPMPRECRGTLTWDMTFASASIVLPNTVDAIVMPTIQGAQKVRETMPFNRITVIAGLSSSAIKTFLMEGPTITDTTPEFFSENTVAKTLALDAVWRAVAAKLS